jgi:hypothetical protein
MLGNGTGNVLVEVVSKPVKAAGNQQGDGQQGEKEFLHLRLAFLLPLA